MIQQQLENVHQVEVVEILSCFPEQHQDQKQITLIFQHAVEIIYGLS